MESEAYLAREDFAPSGSTNQYPPPRSRQNRFNKRFRRDTKQTETVRYGSNTVLNLYPRLHYFQILCGNYGAEELCRLVFNSIQSKRLIVNVTLDQLIYCVLQAHAARCYIIASEKGYLSIEVPNIPQLKEALMGLQLPELLAKYIETIGVFKLASSATLAPWVSTRDRFYSGELQQTLPEDVLRRSGRTIPNNYWRIDCQWIIDWNLATASLGILCRRLSWTEMNGSIEMVITPRFEAVPDKLKLPTSPQLCSDSEGQLGALYVFRRFEEEEVWPGQTSSICTDIFRGTEIDAGGIWSILIARMDL